MELHIPALGRVLPAAPGANLLATLREHGVPISYSCTAGRCGTCRCKLIEGKLGSTDDKEVGGQYVLACTSVLLDTCTIEVPEPDEVITHPARILKATVTAVDQLTHDVRRLRLRPAKPLAFSPGQYATLQFTPEHIRPYSMAGLMTDEELEFHVRVVPDGRVTGYIDRQLKVGDTVRVSGPLGTSYLRRKHEGPMLCVAGGTGLAPVLSIVRGAIDAGMRNDIHLYFGVRGPRDVYGLDTLARLAAGHRNLHLHVVVADGAAADGMRSGLVTDAVAQDWRSLEGWRAYLCGAPPMVDAATLVARERGIAFEHIYADAFYARAA
ncbi:FAD-binding oxidoreductase [Massilia suwonensis]|uniref:FAD-binding oxidoreductase n=1 Tax=Massilia suwonensis TaxID=648895 RepID=A0ABW0MKJ8_9BURK